MRGRGHQGGRRDQRGVQGGGQRRHAPRGRAQGHRAGNAASASWAPTASASSTPRNDMNATFAADMLPKGRIGFFSQSGAMGIAIMDWAIGNEIGLLQVHQPGQQGGPVRDRLHRILRGRSRHGPHPRLHRGRGGRQAVHGGGPAGDADEARSCCSSPAAPRRAPGPPRPTPARLPDRTWPSTRPSGRPA